MARKSVFEKYYAEVRESGRPLDEVDFFEALSKTKFKESACWKFKAIFNTNDEMDSAIFNKVDDFIGCVFDKCTVGNNKIIQIYYNREFGLVSAFMVGRDD